MNLASTGLDPISILNTFGWPTLVAFGLGIGWLVPGYLYKRAIAERDEYKVLFDGLLKPALEKAEGDLRIASEQVRRRR